jgi:hypothetical protein
MITGTLEQALRSSVFLLMDERRRLEQELMEMEMRMTAARTVAESASLQERMAAHKVALAELQRQEEAERQAEAQRRAEAAAKARREALTGHARALADAHHAKLAALASAEGHMAAAVEQINTALQAEAAERAAATAMALELNVETTPLQFSGHETVGRLVGGICAYLARLSVCRLRRLGYLTLPPDDPRQRSGETWAEREARCTAPSVELLLEHADTRRAN